MLAFLNWRGIAALIIGAVAVSVWLRFQFLEADLHKANAALADARQMLATAQAQLAVNQAATQEHETTERVATHTRVEVAAAQQEITDAATRQDAHAMYVAYAGAIERLWSDAA